MYYCVVEDYDGRVSVESYLCVSLEDERRAAMTMKKAVHFIGEDRKQALQIAARTQAVMDKVNRLLG